MPNGCTQFPFEQDMTTGSLRRASSINDTIKSAIKVFILTRPGQRRGNPVGSFVSDLKHKILPEMSYGEIGNQLQQELTDNFPGVVFTNVEVTHSFENQTSTLNISITFQTALSGVEELRILL